LNVRERFLKTMHFEKVDRPPLCEFLGYWPETVQGWYAEGFPADADLETYFGFDPGLTPTPWKNEVAVSSSLSGHVDLDPRMIPIEFGPIPSYGPMVLEDGERYRLVLDAAGVKKRFVKGRVTGMPQFVEHPVKDVSDFTKMKLRFKSDDIRRFPLNLMGEMIDYYNRRNFPLGVEFPGFFGTGRKFMGTERFLIAFHRDPELISEMMEFWGDFVTATLETVVEQVRIDFAVSWEDMAYRKGPHISPRLFREFLQPQYEKVTSMLRSKGVDIIIVDSDGNIESLILPFLESGVNGIVPLECGAGMNAVSLRERYGQRLIMIGNIDRRALVAGPEAIRNELDLKLTSLLSIGGYLPSLDHEVPPEIPLSNYRCYVDLLKSKLSATGRG